MYPSQQKAIDRIVRFYQDDTSKNYEVTTKVEETTHGAVLLTVKTHWLGDPDQMGALCTDDGYFTIGKKGAIRVRSAYGGIACRDRTEHIAFMLNATCGYKHKRPRAYVSRPSIFRGRGKTSKVWDIADANKGKSRAEILALCVEAGVNKHTAATQYQRWHSQQKIRGQRS